LPGWRATPHNSAVIVEFGSVDSPPDCVDRITRRLAELVKPFSPVYDDEAEEFDTTGGKSLASTILSHLIRAGPASKVKTPFLLMLWVAVQLPFPSKKTMPTAANKPLLPSGRGIVPVLQNP
jgi:hypothetical protein